MPTHAYQCNPSTIPITGAGSWDAVAPGFGVRNLMVSNLETGASDTLFISFDGGTTSHFAVPANTTLSFYNLGNIAGTGTTPYTTFYLSGKASHSYGLNCWY